MDSIWPWLPNWLEIHDIDILMHTSKSWRSFIQTHRLRRRVLRQYGFPSTMRFRYWIRHTYSTRLDWSDQRSLYVQLLQLENEHETATLSTTGIEGEIYRDVQRTFPLLSFFQAANDGQRQLTNVLLAVARHIPDVAYCQGMNYVAATLLLLLNNVHHTSPQILTFSLLTGWIQYFEMDLMWKKNMPGVSQSIYLYQYLLRRHFYDLYAHFRHIGLHPSLIVTQWFVTLFTRVLSIDVLMRVWDVFVVDGWKMMFRLALAITHHLRPRLLEMDMEEMSEYLRYNPTLELESISIETLFTMAMKFKITRSSLKQIKEERHLEFLKLRLQNAPLSTDHALLFPSLDEQGHVQQQDALEFIRSQIDDMDSSTASDMKILRQKIEGVDKTIATTATTLSTTAYALSEVAFARCEHRIARRQLFTEFKELMATAVHDATSPRSKQHAQTHRIKLQHSFFRPLLSTWPAYLQQRVSACFERVLTPVESVYVTDVLAEDEEDVRQYQPTIHHLQALVPHIANELQHALRQIMWMDQRGQRLYSKYKILEQQWQMVQAEVEEAHLFKERLADQIVQLMLEAERHKNHTMQQLFAKVDQADKKSNISNY